MRVLALLFAFWAGCATAMTLEVCEARVATLFETYPRTKFFADPTQALTEDGWCVFSGPPDSSLSLPPDRLQWRLERVGEDTLVHLRLAPITLQIQGQPTTAGGGLLRYRQGFLEIEEFWYGQGPMDRVTIDAEISGVDLSTSAMAQFSIGSARLESAQVQVIRAPGVDTADWAGFLITGIFGIVSRSPQEARQQAMAAINGWPDPPIRDTAREALRGMMATFPDRAGTLRLDLSPEPPMPVVAPVMYLLFGEVRPHLPTPQDLVESMIVTGSWTPAEEDEQ